MASTNIEVGSDISQVPPAAKGKGLKHANLSGRPLLLAGRAVRQLAICVIPDLAISWPPAPKAKAD